MSVRRLADENVQPESFKFNRENSSVAKGWIKKYPKERKASAVIPLLMIAQEQEGWVTKASIEHVAGMLEMPYIRVLEVATFYTQFMLKPVGSRAHIQVCGTTPCMLRGSEKLMAVCKRRINQSQFETNEAGTLSWEEVECQGACVNAPMIMVAKDTYEDLTEERLEELLDAFEAGNGNDIKPGPQIDRIYSAPAGGMTTLQTEIVPSTARKSKAGKSEFKKQPSSATKPARPASHVSTTAPAVDTPVGKRKSAEAQQKEKAARAKAGTHSPKGRQAAAAPSLDDKNRPPQMQKPASADDLKRISGVGPKLEGVLNDLGIYTFAQIAKWKKAERDWVDGYLRFKGRIERDNWVKQAKELAKE
jgi:NADH-quinone oxidoreductase subunit E